LRNPRSAYKIHAISVVSLLHAAAFLCCCIILALLISGCAEEPVVVTSEKPVTSTAPAYKRQQINYFRGIAEPRSNYWTNLVEDVERLRADGFNIASISPPVLINQRAGGKPRVGLEGATVSATASIDDIHQAGLAVFLAPTTDNPGFRTEMEPTEETLNQLSEDVLRWAAAAERTQTELFSPLSNYNLVLGTDGAGRWSDLIMSQVHEIYRGQVVAMVVPDLNGPPAAGERHDFENLNYTGYDYLMIEIFPTEDPFNQERFDAQVKDILQSAVEVAKRDGLKGVIIRCGAWRYAAGVDTVEGPQLGEERQAAVIDSVMKQASPRSIPLMKGIFFLGWTLPGRGAKDFAVEQVLKDNFGEVSKTTP